MTKKAGLKEVETEAGKVGIKGQWFRGWKGKDDSERNAVIVEKAKDQGWDDKIAKAVRKYADENYKKSAKKAKGKGRKGEEESAVGRKPKDDLLKKTTYKKLTAANLKEIQAIITELLPTVEAEEKDAAKKNASADIAKLKAAGLTQADIVELFKEAK